MGIRSVAVYSVADAGTRHVTEAIEVMGDKIAAKARVSAAGVPVVPEIHKTTIDPNAPWFPVPVKPSAGGGGRAWSSSAPPRNCLGRFYRDAKLLEIGEGTSEIQRMLIARGLGLS